ncbi:MAG TPA: acylphosphatase [Alphaproteobacteria bacterium]|nr:acylphosphatase [Alphaproteobacteria bacterium]
MTEPANPKTVRLFVSGRVQGVWFRGWTVDTGEALGLSGWVRNRRDGRVEIVARGAGARIDSLIAACRKGPPAALVERVTVEEIGNDEPVGPLGPFAQVPTV